MNDGISNAKYSKKGIDAMPFLSHAKWIGAPYATSNADWTDTYEITTEFEIMSGGMACLAIAARNRDNYIHIEITKRYIAVSEVSDGRKNLCGKYYMKDILKKRNIIRIEVCRTVLSISLNERKIIDNEELIPHDIPNKLRKAHMMNFGLPQYEGEVRFFHIRLENTGKNELYQESFFENDNSVLSVLGTVEDGSLIVKNEFNLINPVPPINVRKRFTAGAAIKRARLFATARGFYEVYINGEKVNDTFYNPGFTDYRKRIYYQTYDVTDMVSTGQNTIGATAAKGYYSGFVGYSGAQIYGTQNTFLCALVIEYADGAKELIVTDDTWEFTDKGAVLDADYQQGEAYDARLEIDWDGDSDIWHLCGAHKYPAYAKPTNGELKDEPFELVPEIEGCGAVCERVLKPLNPAYENLKNHFVFDLGQNMVGTVRIKMKGEKGRTIQIRYGEMCRADGKIYNENYRNAANIDTYTMKGGDEEFIPSFTAHGFRYIEISGSGKILEKADFERMNITVEGLVITNTSEMTGFFECSNPDVNRLYKNIVWSQRGNSLLTFTDCPQRNERMGWTGDAQVFAKTAAYNMNVKSFMRKWLTDLRDAQLMYNKDGAVPDTAPLGGDNRPYGGCVGWGDAAVIVPWEMYKAYGDTGFLSDNYEMMKKWVDYENSPERQKGFIQINPVRGDHLAIDASTPPELVATAYAANSAQILSKTAAILGHEGDTKKYGELFGDIKTAFCEKWVKTDGTLYYGDTKPSQTAYSLMIDFGLADITDGARQGLRAALTVWDNKLSVGFLGISHLMNALTKAGLTEEAFALLEETGYPSWLYSVRNGATTIWERWNSYISETDTFGDANMNSFNHYSYGAVGEWMYSSILGINTSEKEGETGYKKIILTPTAGGTLTYAKGSLKTKYGVIKSEWKIENGCFKYYCTIPENTTADLYLNNKKIPLTAGEYKFESEER